ncbi:hypothetical protein ACJBU6_06996 [Exserohilum turcicum]
MLEVSLLQPDTHRQHHVSVCPRVPGPRKRLDVSLLVNRVRAAGWGALCQATEAKQDLRAEVHVVVLGVEKVKMGRGA